MSSTIINIHGLSGPTPGRCHLIAADLSREFEQLGFRVRRVEHFEWSSGKPGWAAAAGAGVGLFLGGVLGLTVRGVLALGALGAAGGTAASYETAKCKVDSAARQLASLVEERVLRGDTVHLVGHSLGTEIVLGALQLLASRGLRVDGLVALHAGTAPAREDYSLAATAAARGILNVYNPLDVALLAEGTLSLRSSIGRKPMRGRRIANFRTTFGHGDQGRNLGQILGARPGPALPKAGANPLIGRPGY